MTLIQSIVRGLIYYPSKLLVRTSLIPLDLKAPISKEKPVVYLLKTDSVSDLIALENLTKKLDLPSPFKPLGVGDVSMKRYIALEHPQSVLTGKVDSNYAQNYFEKLLELHKDHADQDYQIVPVSVFWGRAPGRQQDNVARVLADRPSPSWLRKLFIILFLGRANFIQISEPVSTASFLNMKNNDDDLALKLAKVARIHFKRTRLAVTGPSLWDREQLFNAILGSKSVKKSINDEAKVRKISYEKAQKRADKYLKEIAADYRETLIRVGDRVLTWVWNRIYDGIKVENGETIRKLAQKGHELVYVPCHRSHMDYLLLTYVIYNQGVVPPHIAAGVNLNFWPAGPIFRHAGAFFIRRSFRGNKLYSAIFREYMDQLFSKGYSIKFYPEGGRSRTGRLLTPQTGMFAMTIQSLLRGTQRPITLVPVYLGYEHVMEVGSYLKELSGKNKKKESVWQIFSAIRKLKNYGYGYVNFGEPIQLNDFVSSYDSQWRDLIDPIEAQKPAWLRSCVNDLANKVMVNINSAAAVNGLTVSAMCLLNSKEKALSERELLAQLDACVRLQRNVPYSEHATVASGTARELLDNAVARNKFDISEDSFGKVLSLDETNAIAMTYYRNNTLHLFAIPSIVANCVITSADGIEKKQIVAHVELMYPLLVAELFLNVKDIKSYVDDIMEELKSQGLVQSKGRKWMAVANDNAKQSVLKAISDCMQETLQRYAIVLLMLEGQQGLPRGALEKESQTMAERLSKIHGLNAPEFFDKKVISTLVSTLKDNDMLSVTEDGLLATNDISEQLSDIVTRLIGSQVVNTIEQVRS